MALKTVVEDMSNIAPDTRREMYSLFERYYDETTEARFLDDLRDKDAALLIRDEEDRLCGFSTLAVYATSCHGRKLAVVFSGDTIIDRAHWGSPAFAFSWIRHIGRIAARQPDLPLFWLLIVKGHRTYRFLPTFGLDFTPDWRSPPDPRLENLKHALASEKFGDAYDRNTGIVRFEPSRGHLSADLAQVSAREARRPDVRFFLERNPGYVAGDEMVCLCELRPDNMRDLTLRLFRQGVEA